MIELDTVSISIDLRLEKNLFPPPVAHKRWRAKQKYVAYYLLDKIDTSKQVHSEIDEGPFDALLLVLFLFEYEHVVVKELLELLVCEVNAELLETVVLLWTIRNPDEWRGN